MDGGGKGEGMQGFEKLAGVRPARAGARGLRGAGRGRIVEGMDGVGKGERMQVFEKLAEFRYEQLVFCHDKATGLRAISAVHDTTLGPAPGGGRMRPSRG